MPEPLDPAVYRDLVARALAEDVGAGDVTTAAVVPTGAMARAALIANGEIVVAGLGVAREVFAAVDRSVAFSAASVDGDRCHPGQTIATVAGPAASVLTAERTVLNFLQYLSGIATMTRRFVDAAAGRVAVLDTRKTTPGLRILAKYAVRCGGGRNHRSGLDSGVLIKDNHIAAAGSIAEAVRRVQARETGLPIEVEAQSLDDVAAALEAGADTIMLDNLDRETMAEAIRRIGGRARVELSGTMSLDRVRDLSTIGADDISVGAITHSAPAVDISLEFEAPSNVSGTTDARFASD